MLSKEDHIYIQNLILGHVFPTQDLPEELQQSFKEFVSFRHELTHETDRGCALLATSYLEVLAEKVFRKVLVGNKKHLSQMLTFNGPLGSFSSKISMLFSLGMVSFNDYKDLQLIRKIRNNFGHSPLIINFDSEEVKQRCDQLNFVPREKQFTSRQRFNTTVSGLAGTLQGLYFSLEPYEMKSQGDDEKTWSTVEENHCRITDIMSKVYLGLSKTEEGDS